MKIRIGALLLVASLLVIPIVPTSSSLQDSPTGNQECSTNNLASMNSLTWHDDCSNVSGWEEPTETIPGIVSAVQPGIPLLANETGLYSDTIPGYAAEDHGSIHIKKLDTPMALFYSLELSVEIEHIGAPNKTGSVGVFLLDAANESVFRVDCYDASNDSGSQVRVAFRDIDGSVDSSYYRRDNAWSYTTRIWYDVTFDSVTAYAVQWEPRLSSSGNFNPNRVAHFVGVAFYNTQFNSYESNIVKDILVTSERDTRIWHNDCSNSTGFTLQSDWPMNWWYEPYAVTSGEMRSSGDYLFFEIPDFTPAERWHGPIYVHTLSTPFRILNLQNFSVHLDVDNSQQPYCGMIDVSLFDSDYLPVVSIRCLDVWNYYSRGYNSVVYWYSNISSNWHGTPHLTPWTSFNGTIRAWYDMEMGLMGYVPGYGIATLASPEEVEVHREIAYIVISAARLTNYAWMPSLIRDIVLSPGTPLSSTTPATTSPTTTTTSTTRSETISIDLFLTLGIAIEIVGIALVITIARLKKYGYYES